MTYGEALELIKQGKRVQRLRWNGAGMFIFIRPVYFHPTNELTNIKSVEQETLDLISRLNLKRGLDKTEFTAYLSMYAADGSIVNGWLASQTDMLSDDWQEYQEQV